ncbi:MAG: zinc ribbon domain-containing protein [Candidatus Lambdaproteobacteria bacterium]|nr:zinc ribbon domain-containing protein [Candidatus Lambdaproteobacteria bacterium]
MPIYEYVCTKCGQETEAIQKFDEPPLVKCGHCNKRGLERKLSMSAFHLQGGGWFSEGYGGGAGKSAKKATEAAKDTSPAKVDNAGRAEGNAKVAASA